MADTITPSRVAVFMALARERRMFRTPDSLAEELKMSPRTCARILQELVASGVVEVSEKTIPMTYRLKVKPTLQAVDYSRRLVLAGGEFGL